MLKQIVLVLSLVSFFGAQSFGQDKPETKKNDEHKHMEHMNKNNEEHDMHHDMDMDDSEEMSSSEAWNKVCPVKGGEVDTEVSTIEYNGKNYGFCCSGCDSKFKKNPEKYSKNLNEDGTEFKRNK